MKLKTFLLTLIITLTYLILIGFFAKTLIEDFDCNSQNSSCFRFCPDVKDQYIDVGNFLSQVSNESISDVHYPSPTFVYEGYPLCGGMKLLKSNENLPNQQSHGKFYFNHERYDFNRYCLKQSENGVWNILICNQDKAIHRVFHFIELRDFHGKCAVPLLANLIATYILSTCMDLYDFRYDEDEEEFLYITLKLSVIHTLLWITVMNFHSLLTFICYKKRTTAPISFSTYASFVIASLLLSAVILFPPLFRFGYRILYIICFIISVLNVIFVIITGIIVFILSRNTTFSSEARYHHERKWFMASVKLSLIFLVTWISKFIGNEYTYFAFNLPFVIAMNIMMLLTAVTVTLIFFGRKKVNILIFEKYREIS